MSREITEEELEKYEAERKTDEKLEVDLWTVEKIKMLSTLGLNLVVIIILAWASVNTTSELFTRFMSLLELVIGAIFGITATQIAKE